MSKLDFLRATGDSWLVSGLMTHLGQKPAALKAVTGR
jgi:hypothetical protein